MNHVGMRHLSFLAKSGKMDDFLEEVLFRADARIWESRALADFSSAYEETRSSPVLTEPRRRLLDLKLLTEYLLFPGHIPEWADDFIQRHPDIQADLPFPVREAARDFFWNAAPAILIGDGEARIRYFIAGASSEPWDGDIAPRWAAAALDETALSEIQKAAAAALDWTPETSRRNLFCYPLIPPGGSGRLTGSSLGLPVALACMASILNIRLPDGVIATGAIERNGTVRRVRNTELKASACAGRFKAFFYPSENGMVHPGRKITAIPVATAAAALTLVRLYSAEHVSKLALFAGMMKNARQFVDNIEAAPCEWIERVHAEGALNAVMDEIAESAERFAILTKRFESLVERFDSRRAQSLSNLISEPHIESARIIAPLSAFRWCAANLSLANHHGRISGAEYWAGRASKLIDDARRADLLSAAAYFNHYFVARQNRYCFQPALPESLHRILDILERQHLIQRDAGSPAHIPLGRLYGTICQNFGFCGPEYIEETLRYAQKARTALGEGTVPEFKPEWSRQRNYLTYAWLDAGDLKKAEHTLCAYLEIDHPDEIENRIPAMTVWEHALTARFLAEAGETRARRRYYDAAGRQNSQNAEFGHPMQLWNYNMGRIAESLGRTKDARGRFLKSLDICCDRRFGSTMRIMALLPLSALYRAGQPPPDSDGLWNTIRRAMEKTDGAHFRELKSMSLEPALESIANSPEIWFPFSYR